MTSQTRLRVKFYDTDCMGVVHHSNYVRWLETGRVEFLRQLGIALADMMADGILFPITEVSCSYHHAAKFDDDLVIETTPTALTRAKMAFDYKIIRPADGALLVTAHTQNVFTDAATGRIKRLPPKYHDKLIAALSDSDS